MTVHLHDVSHDNAVDELWSDVTSGQCSFGCMLSQVCGTVVLQHTPICPKWGTLGRHNEHTLKGEHKYTHTQVCLMATSQKYDKS